MLIAVIVLGFGIIIFQLAAFRILFVDIVKQLRMINIRAERSERDGLEILSVEEEAAQSIRHDAGLP